MQVIKNNFWPVVIIFAAGFLVVFAFWPLENSEWAEGFRSGEIAEGEMVAEEEPFGEEGRLTGPAALLPMVKVAILMGIGVLFTSIGRGIGRLIGRFTSGSASVVS